MAEKAWESAESDVSVGNVSMGLLVEERRREARVFRLSGLRARRATARFPWEGEERMRAMPAPFDAASAGFSTAMDICKGCVPRWGLLLSKLLSLLVPFYVPKLFED